jgi:hypothetical protein
MTNAGYQQLAKEFMDLWQKQVASVVSDKQFLQSMLEMFQVAQSQFTPGQAGHDAASASAESGYPADANAGLLADLAFRVAMCEKRLAALEQPAKPKRKPAAKRAAAGARAGSKKPRK